MNTVITSDVAEMIESAVGQLEDDTIVVVTHNGVFHADEVFAIALLMLANPGRDFTVVRTRNPRAFNNTWSNYVIDVGGVYDPAARRLDHHQKEFALKHVCGIPYASFGLVVEEMYKHPELEDGFLTYLEPLVENIDGWDNGVRPMFEGNSLQVDTISTVISSFVPPSSKSGIMNERFFEALEFAKLFLTRYRERYLAAKEDKQILETAIARRSTLEILELPRYMPWQQAAPPEVLYAVFQDPTGDWRAVCAKDKNGRDKRPFPLEWRGLSGTELEQVSGIEGLTFVHRNGFILGAKTHEVALEAAHAAMGERDA